MTEQSAFGARFQKNMDYTCMKRFLIIELALLFGLSASAQTMADDAKLWAEGWKYAFSVEGRQNWKPEFTARYYAGVFTEGPAITGGVRIDDKRTFGLMVWQGNTWIDAAPASVYTLSSGLYMRRYFHLGKKDVVALYSDFAVGAGYIYKVDGKYWTNTQTGEKIERVDESPGDIEFAATWQPGIRLRFWRNVHLFLGPTISTNTLGLHLGVGF